MHVTFIVKVTRGCNLRCTYCSDWRNRVVKMDAAVHEALIDRILGVPAFTHVSFVWHGGEPLLCGLPYFEEIVERQSRLASSGRIVKNYLQTNGLLLTDELVDFFEKQRFSLGLSLDGPPELQDAQRPRPHDRASTPGVIDGLQLLRQRRVPHGVLCVVTRRTVEYGAARLFEFFMEIGVTSFGVLAHRPELVADGHYDADIDYVSNEDFSRFQRELFDAWHAFDDPRVVISDFNGIVESLLGRRSAQCTLAGDCIGGNFSVEMDGDVYHCDHFNADPDYRTGNLLHDTATELFQGATVRRLLERDAGRLERLQDCGYFDVCHGGCPADDYVLTRTIGEENARCCGKAALIDHIAQHLEVVVGEQLERTWTPIPQDSPRRRRKLIPVGVDSTGPRQP